MTPPPETGQDETGHSGPDAGPPHPATAWFDEIAEFLGPTYLRYSFTKGTDQEVDFLVGALGLETGMHVLDAGCGPGRHSLALARRGVRVTGVDHSARFVELARTAATEEDLSANFVVGDVLALPVTPTFDAVICLCQGGFGLLGGDRDDEAFAAISGCLRPGGRLALSAFSAAFAIRHLEDGDHYDPATGVFHEVMHTLDADGNEADFEGWTTCFTARELRLLARTHDIAVDAVHGVTPGAYAATAPALTHPELLLLAHRP